MKVGSAAAGVLVGVLLMPGPAAPAVGAAGLVVTGVTVQVRAGEVEVAIAASGPVGYRVQELVGPARVVIDVPGASNGVGAKVIPVHQGPVVQVRVGQFVEVPPVTRVVVDLAARVRYTVVARSPGVVAGFVLPGATSGAAVGTAGPAGPAAGVVAGPAGVGGITVVTQAGPGQGPKLTLDLREAGLPDVLDALARICGLNLVTDSSVGGKVTIRLVGVTCEEALRFLLEANGLGFRRVGETIIVAAAGKLIPPPPPPVTRVYRLQYVQPPLAAPEPLVGTVGASSAGGAGLAGGAGRVAKDVAALLDLFKGTGAQLGYDDRTNALVVTGTPMQQEAVGVLLAQLDVPVAQVMVQATVVDITSNSLRDLGIEWSVLQGSTGTPFGFFEVPPATLPPVGGTPPGQLGIQAVNRDALLAKLHAFMQEGHAKVLSDPRVATPDGQEALIFAGDQIPIVNTTTAGNPPVTSQTVTFQPIGVTLKIIPKVNGDRTVTVQVHPVVTTATAFTAPTAQNPGGLPLIAIREAVTSLRVADGASIILGGLMRFSDVASLKKVPFLGDLPFLGSLFQLTTVTHTESEVVIIMTPRILATGAPVQ